MNKPHSEILRELEKDWQEPVEKLRDDLGMKKGRDAE